jgi:hypothetical protein
LERKNSISRQTVCHRVLTGNVDGTNAVQISPVADIEPLIADFCIGRARLGEPLSKTLVINLANGLISDTDCSRSQKSHYAQKQCKLDHMSNTSQTHVNSPQS